MHIILRRITCRGYSPINGLAEAVHWQSLMFRRPAMLDAPKFLGEEPMHDVIKLRYLEQKKPDMTIHHDHVCY